MMRGTIVSLKPIRLLPTFAVRGDLQPDVPAPVRPAPAQRWALSLPYEERDGAYQRYTGDASVPGKGEILVWQPLRPARRA